MTKHRQNHRVAQTLGIEATQGSKSGWRKWVVVGLILLTGLGVLSFWQSGGESDELQYKMQEARRGDLMIIVTATGNLEPTNQVDVGSELSGIIDSVKVDYNDRVEAGQILAELDTDKLRAQVLQSEAALAAAQAKVKLSQATVLETRLKLQRCQRLAEKQLCAQEELDTDQAAYRRAQAEEGSAQAQVAEAQAKLDADRTNLAKAVIHSPIDGVVLQRTVEPGQTVAASLQAPVLFTLAEDLAEMELHVDVDEADVGQVHEGQTASFTVDAFAERSFRAEITQVRFAAQEVDGVITYETILKVDNSDLSLRPGMTATAEILVKRVENALLVPNAALRFDPNVIADTKSASRGGSLLSKIMPRPPRMKKNQRENSSQQGQQQVWTLRDGSPLAIPVSVGTTDGLWTEITVGDLQPGNRLLVGSVRTAP